MNRRGSSRAGRAIIASALALAAAIVMTWPLASGFGHLGRTTSADGQYAIWNVAWVANALGGNPLELFDANIFYPHRWSLAFSEANIVAGLVAAPTWWLTRNPYAAHNTAVLFAFATSALGAWLLARRLTGNNAAAMFAGAAYAFCPYYFAHTAHIQLLMGGGIPIAFLLMHDIAEAPTRRRAIALGLTLAAQALACAYYGIYAGLCVGLMTIFYAATRSLWKDRRYWIEVAIAAGVSVAIVVPFFIPFTAIQEGGFSRPLWESARYAANIQSFLASSAHAHRWLLEIAVRMGRWNEVLFPGIAVTVFCIAGYVVGWRRAAPTHEGASAPRTRETILLYSIVGGVALWASFGPAAGLYSLLFKTIPLFSFLRAPARLGPVIVLAMAMIAAIGLARILERFAPRTQTIVGTVVALLTLLELNVLPFPWERAPRVPDAYRVLATLPRAPLAVFPFYGERGVFILHAQYMLFSTFHWQPMLNGYSDHIPLDFREAAPVLASFPSQESFTVLRRRRVRYLAIHWDMYVNRREQVRRDLEPYLRYLRPLAEADDMSLYEIMGFP